MTSTQTNILLIAAGAALMYVGDKAFEEAGHTDTAGSTLSSLGGLGLGILGAFKIDATWGKYAGIGLGGLAAYNAVRRLPGQPLVNLEPLHFPKMLGV